VVKEGFNPRVKEGRWYLKVPSRATDMAEGGGKMAVDMAEGYAGEEEGADRWDPHVTDRKKRKRFSESA
jgi:hypothetical protein